MPRAACYRNDHCRLRPRFQFGRARRGGTDHSRAAAHSQIKGQHHQPVQRGRDPSRAEPVHVCGRESVGGKLHPRMGLGAGQRRACASTPSRREPFAQTSGTSPICPPKPPKPMKTSLPGASPWAVSARRRKWPTWRGLPGLRRGQLCQRRHLRGRRSAGRRLMSFGKAIMRRCKYAGN